MAHLPDYSDEPITEINVVPLVDVVLVLLIIFMVTASFISKPAIDMRLPSAETGERKRRNQFSLVLGRDGSVAIGDRRVEPGRIDSELRRLLAERRRPCEAGAGSPGPAGATGCDEADGADQLTMVIQADVAVPHGRIISVLDHARRVGIRRYAFNVDPAQP